MAKEVTDPRLLTEELQELEGQIDFNGSGVSTPFVAKIDTLTKNAETPTSEIQGVLDEIQYGYGVRDHHKDQDSATQNEKRNTPEHGTESKLEKQHLASLFEGAASYIETYTRSLENDSPAGEVRDSLTRFFRTYSNELNQETSQGLSKQANPATQEEIERFLLGDRVYENRLERLRKVYGESVPENVIEETRRKIAVHYLQGLTRVPYRSEDEDMPWRDKVGPVENLQSKTQEGLEYAAATPVRETISNVIKEGLSTYINEHPQNEDGQTLRELLNLDKYKSEWETLQKQGDPSAMTTWLTRSIHELSIGLKSALPYEADNDSLQMAVENQRANCALYAMLGTALLEELDVPHVELQGYRHAFVAYVTPDNKVYTSHFQGGGPMLLQQSNLEGTTPEDMADFIRDKGTDVKSFRIPENSPLIVAPIKDTADARQAVYAYRNFPPGLASTLSNMQVDGKSVNAHVLLGYDNVQETRFLNSDAAVKRAIAASPNDPKLYGRLFYSLDASDLRKGLEISSPETLKVRSKWRQVAENSTGKKKASKLSTFWRSLFKTK